MVHSRADYESALEASQILFGKGTAESLKKLPESDFVEIFEGVPQYDISKIGLQKGIDIIELLATHTTIFPSKGEARRMIKGGGVSVNKERVSGTEETVSTSALLNDKYILIQKGKKNYYVLKAT